MFEDSTFESNGRIRTRSRGWMLAAFVFNGSILLALILIPLIYPEALPRQMLSILLEAPRAASAATSRSAAEAGAAHPRRAGDGWRRLSCAAEMIPITIAQITGPEAPANP